MPFMAAPEHRRDERRARSLVFTLLLAIASTSLLGQSLPIQSYTTDDGLSYSQIWALYQDSRGYIWVGTAAGPNRWDGSSFTPFTRQDGLTSETIRTIIEDDTGVLWFGTEDGVASFDGRKFENFVDLPGLNGTIWASTKDQFGRIWFGTHLNGATFFHDDEVRTVSIEEGLASKYVYGLFADAQGFLWFGHRGEGVTRCRADLENGIDDCRRFGLDDGLPNLDVHTFAEDERGFIYIGTRGGGIARWDGERIQVFDSRHGIGEGDVYALIVAASDEIAVGTLSGGVAICQLPDFEGCRAFTRANGLPDNVTLSLLQDDDEAFWVGFETGLSRISTDRMLSFTVRDGLPHSTCYAVQGDPSGDVWIGTLGGLARVRINEEANTAEEFETFAMGSGLPGDQIWDMLHDAKGRIWFATDEGLCEFDTSQGRCSRVIDQEDGLPSDDLLALHEGSNGELIVSTTEGVSIISLENDAVSVKSLSVDDGLAGNVIYGISSDRYGRIWIGSDQGLSVIDGNQVSSYTTVDGLPIDDIHSLHTDRNGVMWIGTNGGGLAGFDPPEPGSGEAPEFVTYGSEAGVNPYIAGMTENEEGQLWLATFRGAMLFDPELARAGGHSVVAIVDRSSGLVSNETNGFTFDSRGNLWIATAGGATRYDPEAIQAEAPRPRVTIEAVVTPDVVWVAPFSRPAVERSRREWIEDEVIVLPPRSASVRVDYRGLSYRGPRVSYQVRLAGFHDEWSDATSTTFKEYTNLFPGNYTFQVRSASRPGQWGAAKSVEFRLLPAWWQRRSTIAAGVIGFFLMLGIGYRARTYTISRRNLELASAVNARTEDLRRYATALEEHSQALDRANIRIREADRVKSEFLANMSHELRTPLNSIIGFSDVLVPALNGEIDDRQHRFLKNVQTSGRYLLLLINNLLDLSKIEAGRADVVPEPARVDEIVETTCEIVQGYAADRRIEVKATFPETMPEVVIDIPKFRQILLNLLSNAVKFSANGAVVEVEVRSGSRSGATDVFELVVRDQGPGISAADKEAIFEEFKQVGGGVAHPGGTGLGLALVRRFVELLGGVIDVESNQGEGSTFTVVLPTVFKTGPDRDDALSSVDSAQPRIIVLSGFDEVFAKLARTMEREGFAPVRVRTLDEAVTMVQRIDPVATVVSIDLEQPDDWGVLGSIKGSPSLSELTIGICLTSGHKIVTAIGADSLMMFSASGPEARDHISSFEATDGETRAPIFIEDTAARLADFGRLFCGDGYSERCATSAAHAVELARERKPSVVMVDLSARSLSGFEAVRRLQHEKHTRHTPIVIVAPPVLDSATAEELASTSLDEITAPLDELALTMHELLRRRSARAVRQAAASLLSRE